MHCKIHILLTYKRLVIIFIIIIVLIVVLLFLLIVIIIIVVIINWFGFLGRGPAWAALLTRITLS